MIVKHLKEGKWTFIYMILQFIFVLGINYYYSDVLTYYLFNKLLARNALFGIKFYEIILTKLYIATIFSIIFIIPFFGWYLILYFIGGLFLNEYIKIKNFYKELIIWWLTEMIWTMLVIVQCLTNEKDEGGAGVFDPARLGFGNHQLNLEGRFEIIQILSFSNAAGLAAQIIIIWLGIAILLKFSKDIEKKRKFIPLIILGMSIWIIPPSLKKQGELTLTLLVYLETKIWLKYWKINRRRVP